MSRLTAVVLAGALVWSLGGTARADMLVAIIGPMSGKDSGLGEEIKRGAEKAIADLNAKGGVLGEPLRAVVGDDLCDPERAVAIAKDMVAQKVAVVIGHVCSGASIPASNVYAEAGILQISPSSTNPELTDRGLANVFRVCGRDDAQGPAAAQYIGLNLRRKTVAIVDDGTTYGKGLALAFKASIEAKGIKPMLYEEIAPGAKDYTAMAAELAQAKADIVYYGGYYPEAGLIVRELRDQGSDAQLIGGDGLNDPKFWDIAGDAAEGTLMTFGTDPKLDPVNGELVQFFKDQNFEPEGYTFYAYGAVQAWAEAVKLAGSIEAAKVEVSLHTHTFETTIGSLTFNSKGDRADSGFVVYAWKSGKPVYVGIQ
jgi:branched-chain amino acid transport system substrate-binding protein